MQAAKGQISLGSVDEDVFFNLRLSFANIPEFRVGGTSNLVPKPSHKTTETEISRAAVQ